MTTVLSTLQDANQASCGDHATSMTSVQKKKGSIYVDGNQGIQKSFPKELVRQHFFNLTGVEHEKAYSITRWEWDSPTYSTRSGTKKPKAENATVSARRKHYHRTQCLGYCYCSAFASFQHTASDQSDSNLHFNHRSHQQVQNALEIIWYLLYCSSVISSK